MCVICLSLVGFPCWNREDQFGVFAESRKLRGSLQVLANPKSPSPHSASLQGSLEHFQSPAVQDLGQLDLVLIVEPGANTLNF